MACQASYYRQRPSLILKGAVAQSKIVARVSMEAAKAELDMLESKQWKGASPCLSLIHCIIDHDNIKHTFLRQHDIAKGRMALENCNSSAKRDKAVWELLCDKWNDPAR
jgi:hypothetical protein